jgi:hypothetical protein
MKITRSGKKATLVYTTHLYTCIHCRCISHSKFSFVSCSGIMFPIKAKAVLPMERVLIRSIAVRGQLGPLTVWITKPEASPDDHQTYTFRLNARHWDKVYDHTLPSSQRTYQTLHLDPPIELRPGQVRALYIHSTLPGDEAIVYDNSYPTARRPARPRYEDSMITIFSGKAHLSPTPFGQVRKRYTHTHAHIYI